MVRFHWLKWSSVYICELQPPASQEHQPFVLLQICPMVFGGMCRCSQDVFWLLLHEMIDALCIEDN